MNSSGDKCKLEFSKAFDTQCSTFFAHTPPNSMVKLPFLQYGFDVHNVLHEQHYAPALLGSFHKLEIGAIAVVMKYLAPPNTMNLAGSLCSTSSKKTLH